MSEGARLEARRPIASRLFGNAHLLGVSIAVMLVAGLSAAINLPRIEDPRITTRNATVLTTLPGASAERVEALVTKKLEDALREVAEIKKIESTSRVGTSLITLELLDAVGAGENETAFAKIRDKLADAEGELPPGASRPEFDDKRGAVAYSLVAAVEWRSQAPARVGILYRVAQELADRLRNVPGTEIVRLYGAPEEEITVTVDPAELAALGLSAGLLASRIAQADAKVPAGVLRTRQRDVPIEVAGQLDSLERVASIPITTDVGQVLQLGDLAAVSKDWRDPPRELALADGSRAVLVAAKVDADIRLDGWAARARDVVRAMSSTGSETLRVTTLFDQSRYTESRLEALGGNLLAGALVVMAVVLVAMGWRAALIVGLALPLSAGIALFGLTFFGQQIHQMTVFGLIIAIGLLIDNAIVVTDEVRRRLDAGLARAEAVVAATRQLASPLLASTLTTILGFMPIFLLPGNVGDFVSPIAISVVLALAASFVVSMSIIAALAGHFQPLPGDARAPAWWRQGVGFVPLARWYRSALGAAIRRPLSTVLVASVLPISGFALAGTLGMQFFPPAERDQFEIELWLPSGTALARTQRAARAVDAVVREHDGVRRVDWLVGGSYPTVYYNLVMNKDGQSSYAHAIVTADDAERASTLIGTLQRELDGRLPEAQVVVSAFGQGPPIDAPVSFRIVGPDPEHLRRYGDELRRIMYSVPGITHTQATIETDAPKLWLVADESQASIAGLTLAQVAEQLEGNLEGRVGGSVLEGLEELPVRIRLAEEERGSLDRLSSFKLVSDRGSRWFPAQALGEFELRRELGSVTRVDGERVNRVLGYTARGVLPIEATSAVEAKLEAIGFAMAPGYRIEVAGDSEEQSRAVAHLATYLPVLALLMIGTLVLTFSSGLLAALVGSVAVMSVGLGILSLFIAGYPLGFNPILGSAGLVGVAINGSIVVLAAIRANPRARAGDREALVDEIVHSTRHILATTLTTIGGFIPLFLSGGDFWPPLAAVIAGGVGFSTTLALFLTPAAYAILTRRASAPSGAGNATWEGDGAAASA